MTRNHGVVQQVEAGMTESSELSPKRPPADPVAGTFVTETFDYDGGRRSRCTSHQISPRRSYSPVTVR
jgi:hypothetical protein